MDRKEKNRGAEINLPDFFPLCTTCQKILPCKLSTIVVDEGGPGGGATIFSLHFQLLCSIFPQILREFLLFIFVISQYCPTVKRILHDWPNLPNNRGGGSCLWLHVYLTGYSFLLDGYENTMRSITVAVHKLT